MLKAKVHILGTENNYRLIAIVSHLSPHKISWMFNQELGAKFQQTDSVEVLKKNEGGEYRFPVYKFEDERDVLYTLYANKAENSSIIKSIKKVDYVLKCEGVSSKSEFNLFIESIKKLANVLAVFEIDQEQLKTKEHNFFT